MRLVPAYTPDPDYIDRQIDNELAPSVSVVNANLLGDHTGGEGDGGPDVEELTP
jgi:hypothetical protein